MLESSCITLLRCAERELRDLPACTRFIFAGVSQGGSVAAYAALSGIAPEAIQNRLQAVLVCCSGVPVLHFLAERIQRSSANSRRDRFPQVRLVYADGDKINDRFVVTMRSLLEDLGVQIATTYFRVKH